MSLRLSASKRRQQIMWIATGLFANKGYEGTTTREIAGQAGVHESLVFRHFPTKEKLYWTIIEELCSARRRRQRVKNILAHGGDDLVVFSAVAREFLVRTPRDRELTRLLWFTALENHTLSERFFHHYVAEYYEALAGYIRGRIRDGKFRKVDPLIAARGFMGMVVYHFLIQELFGAEKYQQFDPAEVAATLAGVWLGGMQSSVAHKNGNGLNGSGNGSSNGNHLRSKAKSKK
jgi:AcrR family transcriptional regulator